MIELLLLGAIGATLILKLSTLNRGKENSAMDIEEYNKELIRSDFEQSMEMLRHYDTFHWDITKFCVSQILIVIGACWYIYEKQDPSYKFFNFFGISISVIAILLVVSELFTLLCVLALLRNRVYFCKMSNYVNELRNNYLKNVPFGFSNQSKMWINYKYPKRIDWISTQFLSVYLLSLCLIFFACTSTYMLVSKECALCMCIVVGLLTVGLIIVLGNIVCRDNHTTD